MGHPPRTCDLREVLSEASAPVSRLRVMTVVAGDQRPLADVLAELEAGQGIPAHDVRTSC